MIDFTTDLYAPIYEALGVSAELRTPADVVKTLTVIDKGKGHSLDFAGDAQRHIGGGIHIETMQQTVRVRAAELAENMLSLDDDLDDGQITLNGKKWRIISHRPLGTPNGVGDGEVELILSDERLDR